MPSRPTPARGPQLPRHTPVSDLIPVLAVEETHFVTTDGRYGRTLACSGINLAIQGTEAAGLTVGRFGDALTFLPPDAGLQLLVLNRPLRGDDWIPAHLGQYAPPPGLADYVRALGAAYRQELAGRHVTDLRFYAVLTLPSPPAPTGALARRFRRRRVLARGREAHARALAELAQAVDALGHALGELDIRTTALGRQGMIDLLWECANPAWGRDVAAPRAEAAPAETRTLRHRLGQSRLVRRREWVRLDGGYEQTLALTALPEATVAGWLRGLTIAGVPLRLALHVAPLQKAQERVALTRTLRQRHAVLTGQAERRRLADFAEQEAYDEASALLQAMASSDLRTFRVAAFVGVRATTAEGLRTAAHAVARALGDAGGTSIDRCQGWQDRAWQATLPLGINPAGLAYRVTTPNLADTLPFLQGRAGTPGGRLIGFSNPGREAVTLDLFHPGPRQPQHGLPGGLGERQDDVRPVVRPQTPGLAGPRHRLRPLDRPLGRPRGGGAGGGRPPGRARLRFPHQPLGAGPWRGDPRPREDRLPCSTSTRCCWPSRGRRCRWPSGRSWRPPAARSTATMQSAAEREARPMPPAPMSATCTPGCARRRGASSPRRARPTRSGRSDTAPWPTAWRRGSARGPTRASSTGRPRCGGMPRWRSSTSRGSVGGPSCWRR